MVTVLIAIIIGSLLLLILMTITGRKSGNISKDGKNKKPRNNSAIIKDANKRLAKDPRNIPALTALGDVYYSQPDYAKAYPLYKSLSELSNMHPEIDEKKSEELQNQEKTGENSSDAEKQTVQEIILFDEYILGEPFEMNSLCEVPVRFVQKKGFVDVVLYFFKNPNGNWKINQLQILKMQKKFKKDVR